MKSDLHPEYGPVVFRDSTAGTAFLSRSTAVSRARSTVEWEDGNTYPVIDVDVSSASHPFWTGRARVLDSEGRVEKFRRRYGQRPSGRS
ncbi:type B 50S ribosomal protein L31 [Quadrisphaera setariae]|uniref:Large ribosomal subunit protein bL31B n=1 Tax=Quadrisphaera setariae TaxID=2593304 RepID=A0A5C8ZMF4_9ACTN|nr:type B 50S ribosomal protein L31 [Quadrisphaera setariae]TXR58166.1 type B 50S ribosomal protein L31 [Quadrisphaera setariae]